MMIAEAHSGIGCSTGSVVGLWSVGEWLGFLPSCLLFFVVSAVQTVLCALTRCGLSGPERCRSVGRILYSLAF